MNVVNEMNIIDMKINGAVFAFIIECLGQVYHAKTIRIWTLWRRHGDFAHGWVIDIDLISIDMDWRLMGELVVFLEISSGNKARHRVGNRYFWMLEEFSRDRSNYQIDGRTHRPMKFSELVLSIFRLVWSEKNSCVAGELQLLRYFVTLDQTKRRREF